MSLISFADVIPMEETNITDESFHIDSYEKAEWALEKAGEAQDVINQIEAEANAMVERIRQAKEDKTKSLKATVERMAYLLDPWARGESEKIRKKTIPLASGEVKIITGRDSLVIDDSDEEFETWAHESGNEDLLTVKVTPSKTAIKKALSNGVEVPGCHLEKGADRLSIAPRLKEITA